jgi:acetolactate synthase-1/2/3 large subunit
VVIDFVVEKEDTVFPMVPAGADLDKMIRRPKQDVMLESGSDKDWEMPAAPVRPAANGQAKKAGKAPKAAKKPAAAVPSRGSKTTKSNRR